MEHPIQVALFLVAGIGIASVVIVAASGYNTSLTDITSINLIESRILTVKSDLILTMTVLNDGNNLVTIERLIMSYENIGGVTSFCLDPTLLNLNGTKIAGPTLNIDLASQESVRIHGKADSSSLNSNCGINWGQQDLTSRDNEETIERQTGIITIDYLSDDDAQHNKSFKIRIT